MIYIYWCGPCGWQWKETSGKSRTCPRCESGNINEYESSEDGPLSQFKSTKEKKMDLCEYVREHTVRGACQCGKCIDAPENPREHQPEGHTADLMFFKVVATDEPSREEFLNLIRAEHPNWLDGKEHSYLEMGADMGDQGIALMTMGLGKLLFAWELLTPNSLMPFLEEEMKMRMAGIGMVTIRAE